MSLNNVVQYLSRLGDDKHDPHQYHRIATDAADVGDEDIEKRLAEDGGDGAVDVQPSPTPADPAASRCCGVERRRWPHYPSRAGTFLSVGLILLCLPMVVIGVAPLISEHYAKCSAGGAALWGSALYISIGVSALTACRYKTTCCLLTNMALAAGGAFVGGGLQCALIGYTIVTRISDFRYYMVLHERCVNIENGRLTVGRPWNWDENSMGVFTAPPCEQHPDQLARAQMMVYVLCAMLGVAVLQAAVSLALTAISCRTTRCYTCEKAFGEDTYKPIGGPYSQSAYEARPEVN